MMDEPLYWIRRFSRIISIQRAGGLRVLDTKRTLKLPGLVSYQMKADFQSQASRCEHGAYPPTNDPYPPTATLLLAAPDFSVLLAALGCSCSGSTFVKLR